MSCEYDVLIAGAGVAGLAAARLLASAGLRTVIAEARNRPGGRIYTHRHPFSPIPVELGAEFIHGRSPDLMHLLDSARILLCDIEGEHWGRLRGSLVDCSNSLEQIDSVLEQMSQVESPDVSFAEFLDGVDAEADTKRSASEFVEGFNAADRNRISARALFEQQQAEDAIEGDRMGRIPGGYDSLVRHLAASAGAEIRLNSVVRRIAWSPQEASVSLYSPAGSDLGVICARRVLITVPLGVLQAGSLQFQPEPFTWLDAARRLAMGHVVRVVLRFRTPFWEEESRLKKLSFLHSRDEWFPVWWTHYPLRAPVLTAWAGGPRAGRFQGHPSEFVLKTAIESLSRLLDKRPGAIEGLLEDWHTHDWTADPFSLGAYSYIPVGGTDAPAKLAEPLDSTLFYAGEAADTGGHCGTVHGALASGLRAAREILRLRS